jgi:hypothetical protein
MLLFSRRLTRAELSDGHGSTVTATVTPAGSRLGRPGPAAIMITGVTARVQAMPHHHRTRMPGRLSGSAR